MARQLQKGDPAPWFKCPASNNPNFSFSTVAGRYIVLCFFGSAANESSQKLIKFFEEMRPHFDDETLTFFGISTDLADESTPRVTQQLPGMRYFWDFNTRVSELYGAQIDNKTYEQFTLILDPMLRVIESISATDITEHNKQFKNFLQKFPKILKEKPLQQPPILILPNVFEPDFCKNLIRIYDSSGGVPSGFMVEKEGYTAYDSNPAFKRRKDYNLMSTPEHKPLIAQINEKLGRRLVPEIAKAFQFHVTHIERYLVACYDASTGGFFKAHRDNTTTGTLHRRFAVTLNLNAEDYQGGDLCFPEFGHQTYRAPTGGAVVFSCSLLHEATPVTRGKRYAFLPFLYDAEASKIRQANAKYIQGDSGSNAI